MRKFNSLMKSKIFHVSAVIITILVIISVLFFYNLDSDTGIIIGLLLEGILLFIGSLWDKKLSIKIYAPIIILVLALFVGAVVITIKYL